MHKTLFIKNDKHLTLSGHRQPDYSVAFGYDARGNAVTIKRRGVTQTSMEQVKGADGVSRFTEFFDYGLVDDLTLSYEGNRLTKVYDAAEDPDFAGANDFVDGVDEDTEYEYDVLGRLTKDKNKGITSIAYNEIGLPSDVFIAGAHIRYTYTASGELLCKAYGTDVLKFLTGSPWSPGIPYVVFESDSRHDYIGSSEYLKGTLERLNHEAGWWNADGRHTAAIRDWQGSLRATWTEGDYTQTLAPPSTLFPGLTRRPRLYKNLTAYYPYGLPFADRQGTDRYLYSGKELDRTYALQLYDFHARTHDPQLARFLTPDPCAERYFPTSPYTYCAANPIAHTDPTGRDVLLTENGRDEVGWHFYHGNRNVLQQSPVFRKIFEMMERSQDTYTIQFGELREGVVGIFSPSTKTITFNNREGALNILGFIEEFYHAYQDIYYEGDTQENCEFEAKVMIRHVYNQIAEEYEFNPNSVNDETIPEFKYIKMSNGYGETHRNFWDKISDVPNFISYKNVITESFKKEYVKEGQEFISIHKNNPNPAYTVPVLAVPQSMIYILKETANESK